MVQARSIGDQMSACSGTAVSHRVLHFTCWNHHLCWTVSGRLYLPQTRQLQASAAGSRSFAVSNLPTWNSLRLTCQHYLCRPLHATSKRSCPMSSST